MDSINTLAIELAEPSSQVRSAKNKSLCYFNESHNAIFEEFLVGEFEMDFDHINKNINTLISSRQFTGNLDEVSKAFIAIVETVRIGNDDDLRVFCLECLFRWPNLSSLPLLLEFDLMGCILDYDSYITACALSRLIIYCDKYKIEFLRRFEEFADTDMYLTMAIVTTMDKHHQLYTGHFPKIVDTLFEYLGDYDDPNFIMPFIHANIDHFNIDKTRLENFLRDENKQKRIISVVEKLVSNENFSHKCAIDWVELLLRLGNKDCILSASNILSTLQDRMEEEINIKYYVEWLIRMVPVHTNVITEAIRYLRIEKEDARYLLRVYPACYSLVRLSLRYKDEIDYNAYVARCFETGFIEETLVAIGSITLKELPLIIDYVGKYEAANKLVIDMIGIKRKRFSPPANEYAYEYEPYTDEVIPRCIDGINVVHSVEIIDNWPFDKTKYANKLWPALENADSSLSRASLMLDICRLEEYHSRAYYCYSSWIPYLHDILNKNASLLQNLPMRLLSSAILTLTEHPGTTSIFELHFQEKSRKFRRILADYNADSNGDSLWGLAASTKDFYIQKMAWRYCSNPYQNGYSICHLMEHNLLEAPSDEVADRFIRHCLQNFDGCIYALYFGRVAAFLYNNTNIPLHLGLMNKITDIHKSDSFFSELLRNLSPHFNKQPLLPLLLKSLLSSHDPTTYIDAVKLIDSSEEANVFCESISSLSAESNN